MNTTPKTDLFIERFARAVTRLQYFKGLSWSNHDYIAQFMRAQEEDVLFLEWHLSGVYKTLPAPNKANYRGRFPDVLEYVLSQPIISYRDIGIELWKLSPNIDELEKYMQIFKTKLNDAVTWLPQRYSLSDVMLGNTPYTDIIRKVQADGFLPEGDAEYILVNVYKTISGIHQIRDSIKQMFNKYLEMVREIPQESKPIHFSVSKSYEDMQRILTALQQQGFISTNTTIETFYYRMTGQGTPTSNKIEWIKKGKKNNSSISKRSLVYFVETIVNFRVSKAKDCTNRIEDIFGLSLSSSTINSTAVCEYKAEIDNIVEVKNNS